MNDTKVKKNKYILVALFGESGSGKDTVQKWAVSNYNINGIVSCTTRPPRDGEENGIDYHFLTNEKFRENILDGKMLESTIFNNWMYGTRINELDMNKINIGVFNIEGLKTLMTDSRLEVIPVWVWVDSKTRLKRALEREAHPNCHEICRRFLSDEEDFREFYEGESYDYISLYNGDNIDKSTYILNELFKDLSEDLNG